MRRAPRVPAFAFACACACACGAPAAFAQTPEATPPPLPPPPPPPPSVTGLPPPPPSDDEYEQRVIAQVEALIARGRWEDAGAVLDAELPRRGVDPRSFHTLAVLRRVAGSLRLRPPALAPAALQDPEAPPPDGRRTGAEAFTLYSTLFTYGVGTGVWLDIMAEVEEGPVVFAPLLLGGAGITAAYFLDNPRGIRRGLAPALNAGMWLGFASGLAFSIQMDEHGPWNERQAATATWIGTSVGAAAGLGIAALTDAEAGSGAFVLSGGLWGGTLGFCTSYLADADKDRAAYWLGGEVVGAGLALGTAHLLRPTAAQTRWMDLGVIGGFFLGMGVAALYEPRIGRWDNEPAVPFTAIQLGMIGGGALGYVLGAPSRTERRRTPVESVRWAPSIAPVQGGGAVLQVTAM